MNRTILTKTLALLAFMGMICSTLEICTMSNPNDKKIPKKHTLLSKKRIGTIFGLGYFAYLIFNSNTSEKNELKKITTDIIDKESRKIIEDRSLVAQLMYKKKDFTSYVKNILNNSDNNRSDEEQFTEGFKLGTWLAELGERASEDLYARISKNEEFHNFITNKTKEIVTTGLNFVQHEEFLGKIFIRDEKNIKANDLEQIPTLIPINNYWHTGFTLGVIVTMMFTKYGKSLNLGLIANTAIATHIYINYSDTVISKFFKACNESVGLHKLVQIVAIIGGRSFLNQLCDEMRLKLIKSEKVETALQKYEAQINEELSNENLLDILADVIRNNAMFQEYIENLGEILANEFIEDALKNDWWGELIFYSPIRNIQPPIKISMINQPEEKLQCQLCNNMFNTKKENMSPLLCQKCQKTLIQGVFNEILH